MPCAFYTANFTRCTHSARAGSDYCGVHQAKAERLGARPAETMCHCVRTLDGREQWCGGQRLPGHGVCNWHAQRMTDRAERNRHAQERMELEERVLNDYLHDPRILGWQAVARECRQRMHLPREDVAYLPDRVAETVARRFFFRTTPETVLTHVFTDFWVDLWREEHGLLPVEPAPQPQGQMARLARDTQNVHTAQVAKQTNGNLEILLEVTPFERQDTLRTLTNWWMRNVEPDFDDYWRVMQDVKHWYAARTCKKTNDKLYQRVLDGLVAKISRTTEQETWGDDPAKCELFEELVKRVWEECDEAVGMCCEGHLARLSNVLVGFDEAFKPPVPVGEILQQRMADIAQLKLSPKLKLQKAVAVMDELAIPIAERDPWLEALEE